MHKSKQGRPSPKTKAAKSKSGAYLQVSAPVATTFKVKSTPATYASSENGTIRVHHREFVTSVANTSTTSFQIVPQCIAVPGLDLTPAATTMFPWLSQIAGNYEKFRFTSLRVELVSSAPTSTPGRVYMALDYDYDDDPNVSKVQLMSNLTAVDGPVWSSLCVKADPKALMSDMPWKFVSQSSRPNFIEARTSHCGFVLIAVDSPEIVLFDVLVEYTVELAVPVLETTSPIDTMASAASTSVPLVIPAFGSGWAATITDSGVPLTGPIKRVVPGLGPIPVLSHLGANFDTALDLLSCPRSGRLGAQFDGVVTASSPSSVLATNDPKVQFNFYDSLGAFLGNLGSITRGLVQTTGPLAGGTIGTAGTHWTAVGSFPIQKLFEALPLVRYAVPFVQALASAGAGTKRSGLLLEL